MLALAGGELAQQPSRCTSVAATLVQHTTLRLVVAPPMPTADLPKVRKRTEVERMGTSQVPSVHSTHAILVPLDRTERAERALPVAERLAAAKGYTLLLVQVSEPIATIRDFPGPALVPHVYQELADIEDQLSREYLTRVAADVSSRGLPVEVRAFHGEPAPALLELEDREQVDLVVIGSHGRGGIERFTFGSVADHILRRGKVPVMVVRPWGDEQRYLSLARALVPLDGSTTAEAALSVVRTLAGDPLRAITLVRVVDPDLPAGETAAARTYLHAMHERLVTELVGRGCAVDDLVLYGREVEQILDRAEDGSDLVILATHGQSGPQRWLLGSVANRVLQGAHLPVLLVRAPQAPHEPKAI
jgi:nucleotide-binding universal stress UspA family protein